MAPALEKGQVTAVHAAEPFASAIRRDLGARVLLDGGASPVSSIPISGYVTTRQFAEKNPKTAAAFQRAITAAQKIASQDPDSVREQLPTYTKVTPDQAKSIRLPAYPAETNADELRRLSDLMRQQGLLKKDIDPAQLLVK